MQAGVVHAQRFLKDIKATDRVGIITHDDLDGFASGILFYDYCASHGVQDIKHIAFTYGKTKLAQMNLEDRTKLLIADIPPNLLVGEFSNLHMPTFYTDHHPSEGQKLPGNVLELRTTAEGYIPSARTVYELCGGKKWWALLGVWADTLGDFKRYKENKEFARAALKETGLSESVFTQLWIYTGNFLIYHAKDFDRAFNFLLGIEDFKSLRKLSKFSTEVEKEIGKAYMGISKSPELIGEVNYHYFESPFEIKSAVISRVSMEKKEKVFILAGPKPGGKVGVSARNQSGIFDMSQLLKNACSGIPEASAGGHKSASGAMFSKEYLSQFKEQLARLHLSQFKQ